MVRRVECTSVTPLPKRSCTIPGSPQSSTDGTPAGGGTYPTVTFSIRPTNPSGVRLAIAIRPPGRVTRSSSAAGRSGWAAASPPAAPVAGEPPALAYRLMRRSCFFRPRFRGPLDGPATRVAAASCLLALLLFQPWLTCLPRCVMEGHGAMVLSHSMTHGQPCHPGGVARHELPTTGPIGIMLPARPATGVPVLEVLGIPLPSPPPLHTRQLPPADPPPPRTA